MSRYLGFRLLDLLQEQLLLQIRMEHLDLVVLRLPVHGADRSRPRRDEQAIQQQGWSCRPPVKELANRLGWRVEGGRLERSARPPPIDRIQ